MPKFDAKPNPNPNSNPNCSPSPINFGQMTLRTNDPSDKRTVPFKNDTKAALQVL